MNLLTRGILLDLVCQTRMRHLQALDHFLRRDPVMFCAGDDVLLFLGFQLAVDPGPRVSLCGEDGLVQRVSGVLVVGEVLNHQRLLNHQRDEEMVVCQLASVLAVLHAAVAAQVMAVCALEY